MHDFDHLQKNLVCKSATRVYKWQFDQREEIDFDDSRNDNIITEDEKKRLELNQKQNIRETYQIAYSYEDIGNILFGKWCLVANNLCILFYLFSCQCSYMTLIKVGKNDLKQGTKSERKSSEIPERKNRCSGVKTQKCQKYPL